MKLFPNFTRHHLIIIIIITSNFFILYLLTKKGCKQSINSIALIQGHIVASDTSRKMVALLSKKSQKEQFLTVSFVAPKGLRVNSPFGFAYWAIDLWPLRAKGLIVLVSPN